MSPCALCVGLVFELDSCLRFRLYSCGLTKATGQQVCFRSLGCRVWGLGYRVVFAVVLSPPSYRKGVVVGFQLRDVKAKVQSPVENPARNPHLSLQRAA